MANQVNLFDPGFKYSVNFKFPCDTTSFVRYFNNGNAAFAAHKKFYIITQNGAGTKLALIKRKQAEEIDF